MSNYHWANPIRVPTTDAPPLEERTHTPDPAAVARLKALMAAQEAERKHKQQQQREAAARTAAALRARRQAKTAPTPKPEPTPKPAPKAAKPSKPKQPKAPRAAKPPRPPRVYGCKLDREQAVALHARRMAGESAADVVASVGITVETLLRTFKRYGLPTPPPNRNGRHRRVTDDQLRELHARYAAGESSAALAAEVGLHRNTLIDSFRRAKLTAKRPVQRCTLTDDQLAAAVAARVAGRPWPELAAALGVPRSTLRMHVKAYHARLEVSQ